MARELANYEVLTFDCYGTLIDWESGIWDALQPLLLANRRTDVTRSPALRTYATLEHGLEAGEPGLPYAQVLSRVHAAMAEHFEMETTAELDGVFGRSLAHWPAFPDTADALRRLARHYRLVILSNVDRVGIEASQRKLGVTFDAVYTAEAIGSYKPERRNFEHLLGGLERDFGIEHDGVLHTAQSLFHDIVPATALGLATAWIDRQRLSEGGDWGATAPVTDRPEPDFRFYSLAEMAEAVEADCAK